MNWLALTHDATGRRGSSKGISLLRGWLPAFPETTGYLMGTFLAYAKRRGRPEFRSRAHELGDWELEIQAPDGGIMEGLVERPRRSIAFNTGMALHGWLDLYEVSGGQPYLDAAVRAGNLLSERQDEDGAWRGAFAYCGIPTTYHTRVAWALTRLARHARNDEFAAAGVRNLEWALNRQRANGWFADCNFKPGTLPNTHGIAYTLRNS
jgi:hypothetical protein